MAIEVLKCKCGAIRGACVEPVTNWWKKQVYNAVKDGKYTLETIAGDVKFTECKCKP